MKSNVFLLRHLKKNIQPHLRSKQSKMKRFFFHSLTIHKHRMNELSETMEDAEVKSLRYFILYLI